MTDPTPTPPARAPWGFRLAAVALGCALAFFLAEVFLRIAAPQPTGPGLYSADPDVLVVPRPLLRGRRSLPGVFEFEFSHTEEAGRVVPGSAPDSAAPEVLLLGDSFTYGIGVDDDETFASRLARGLAARGTPARVTNAGRPGGAPDYAFRLLLARDWTPDVVVYAFYANDFGDLQREAYFRRADSGSLEPIVPRLGRWESLKLRLTGVPGYNAVRSHSQVASLLSGWMSAPEDPSVLTPGKVDMDTLGTPVTYAQEPQRTRGWDYLRRLRDEVSARGSSFLLVYLPSAAQVAAYRRTSSLSVDEATFLQIASALGTEGFTLSPVLAEVETSLSGLYYPESHWRPLGHRIAGQAMLDPVQVALCVQILSLDGCATAPPDVRRIVEMRAGRESGE